MFGHTISNAEYIRHNTAWQSSNLKRSRYEEGMSTGKKVMLGLIGLALTTGVVLGGMYAYITYM